MSQGSVMTRSRGCAIPFMYADGDMHIVSHLYSIFACASSYMSMDPTMSLAFRESVRRGVECRCSDLRDRPSPDLLHPTGDHINLHQARQVPQADAMTSLFLSLWKADSQCGISLNYEMRRA